MKKKIQAPKSFPTSSKDVFVTQKMLYAVRDELKSEIKSSTSGLRSEMHGLKSEVHGIKSQMHKLESAVAGLSAQVYRAVALAEEQNARNIVVMDGLTSLFGRQDRVESRLDDLEKTIASFRR